MLKSANKEDLRLVALELGEKINDKMSVANLSNVIKNSNKYQTDPTFVENLITEVVEFRKSEEDKQYELEKIKLEKLKLELELAKLRAESKVQSSVEESDKIESLDSIIKSVRTLTLKIPVKPEGWGLFFTSLERAFVTKNVPEKFKAEILLNLLGDRAANVITYIKDNELCDYPELKKIVLREFEPTPHACLENFRKAVKFPNETYMQFSSRLTTSFEYYLSLRNVSDFETLKQLIISDKIFQTLDRETSSYITVKMSDSWYKPIELAKEVDLYCTSRGKPSYEKSNVYLKNSSKNFAKVLLSDVKNLRCVLCEENHPLYRCKVYKSLCVRERLEVIKNNNICYNCLALHKVINCDSKRLCIICKKKHHSSICYSQNQPESESVKPQKSQLENNSAEKQEKKLSNQQKEKKLSPHAPPFEASCLYEKAPERGQRDDSHLFTGATSFSTETKTVLLSTINCLIKDSNGSFQSVRCILDQGSMCNFITESLLHKLKLKKEKINITVAGLNELSVPIKARARATIANEEKTFFKELNCLIVPKITDFTPARPFKINLPELSNVKLSDKNWFLPGAVDMLLGGEYFYQFLKPEQIFLSNSNLVLQNSVFGFIVGGSVLSKNDTDAYCGIINQESELNRTIERFWDIENLPEPVSYKSEEEIECNEHFLKSYKRDKSGKFVVQMPLKKDPAVLGESKHIALNKLNCLWRRLEKQPELLNLYCQFLDEYERLGHMERVVEENEPEVAYYMPHHPVYRPEKSSTKLRVVFNGSQATTSGESLNSIQLNGGVIQEDLFSIILRFRIHRYAFIADVKMMYRMILIDEVQRDLQRILWKSKKDEEIKVYRLCTVTYGTTSAPYLAMRCLQQLGIDGETQFPLAAAVVQSSFYMDDVLSGSYDLQTAKKLQSELIELLETCGMQLHKWCCNHPELMKTVSNSESYNFDKENSTKALGQIWSPQTDSFSFSLANKARIPVTKRSVLSLIAMIFDPLGLLGPIVTKAKIFLQNLWRVKLDWDDELPEVLADEWQQFQNSLKTIDSLMIDRCVLSENPGKIALFGFCDASEKAYGATVYLVCTNPVGEYSSKLLCSKSRVAPLKTVTIPRLELCAAVLLTKLMKKVSSVLKIQLDFSFYFTDSTIVLAWLNKTPADLKTFVATRVATIQRLSKINQWKHVQSADNPADLISRGVDAYQILHNQLWWQGPQFLVQVFETFSVVENSVPFTCDADSDYTKELKTIPQTTLILSTEEHFLNTLLNITNDYLKLMRIVSYLFRFMRSLKTPSETRRNGPVVAAELDNALAYICKLVQKFEYAKEIGCLQKGQLLPVKSKLRTLNPFIDEGGILRVGGRLSQSNLPFDTKFPIILPAKHKLSELIMRHFHIKNLHIGPQTLMSSVRSQFWIVHGRNLARRVVHECLTCFKAKPITAEQIMGVLPAERVTPGFPFNICGIDFCGPFLIRYKGQRKGTLQKVYVAVFVCFATKAIHLEIVSDLTTAALLAALKRFFARRGKISKIFSDNAKNFVGAALELKRLQSLIRSPDENLSRFLASEGIEWSFLPPRAPNFGGLWEAGVKSFKHHLRRVTGNSHLTFEEFLTVVTQIEGILNSRPMVPMSSDANDFNALTPAHFLIGRPVNALVEPDIVDQPYNTLTRWKRTTRMVQQIWKLWHRDYISHLQQRYKWQIEKNNIKIGSLVLLKEDNLPPCKWVLGRVIDLIPGPDKRIRVVNVKTPKGVFKRSISKICILPLEKD